MSKIIIIGSDGQLGSDLKEILTNTHKVIGATLSDFDVTDKVAVENFIGNHKPAIIINTAAYHKTEECELNPEKSFQINALGAYYVAKAASMVEAKSIYISTDYVFDGHKQSFSENDLPNPLNVYGFSKLAGEILTKIANQDYYIIRTSWLFGVHKSSKGHNFVSLLLDKAAKGENIRVVDDQFGSPTNTHDLSLKIRDLIAGNAPTGIYHLTNSGSCSWFEFAQKIFQLTEKKVDLLATSSQDLSYTAKRPKSSVLDNNNLIKYGFTKMRFWEEALEDYLKTINAISRT